MAFVFSILTLVLCLAVSGCAGLLGTDSAQPPQATAAPPDKKKLAELVGSAFQMAKLSGTGEVSPLRATQAPQRGDWMVCIKSSAPDQTRYAVFIKDNAISDVRPAVVIDGCYNETYEPTGAP
jgi:hypothetical protein